MGGLGQEPRSLAGEAGRGFLVVVSGPSGVGKNTLVNRVLSRWPVPGQLVYSVSATTRPPRPGEVEGRDYFFLGREQFEERIRRQEFLEWAEFCGHLYGTPRQFVEAQIQAGRLVITDIDIQGAAQLRQRIRDAVFVFLVPPSMEELRARLERRGAEGDEAIAHRLASALTEMDAIVHYDYAILNDRLEDAAARLEAVLVAETCRVGRSPYRRLARDSR